MITDAESAYRPITPLTKAEQANDYPYQAPAASYLIEDGRYRLIEKFSQDMLADRVAVLSVGSNRAPQQLYRKFGDEAVLPVTRAMLYNCDICHSACFSYYGAVPCSAYPSFGTSIMLNAVWLTKSQLQVMHDTEAVGIAYDFCRWDKGVVEIFDAPQPDAIYGYATRLGYLDDKAGNAVSLSALPAQNRTYQEMSQQQARRHLYQRLPASLAQDNESVFMAKLVEDKQYRFAVNDALQALAQKHTISDESNQKSQTMPWQIIPATPHDADSYL